MDSSNSTSAPDNLTVTVSGLAECQVCSEIETITQGWFIIQMIFPAVTFTANMLTSIAIYRASAMKASLRLSLLNLSVTDLTASLVYIYHIAFAWTHFQIGVECITRYVLFVTTQVVTLLTVAFMSLERCLALFLPYVYERFNGTKFVKFSLGIVWCITLVYVAIGFSFVRIDGEGCFYPLLFESPTHYLYAVGGLFSITLIIICNMSLFVLARIQISKIAPTLVGTARKEHISRMGIKSVITTITVVLPFVAFNSPMYCLLLMFAYDEEFTKTSDALYTINSFSSIALVNSLCNPAIYIWKSQQVRRQLGKILYPLTKSCHCCCSGVSESSDDRRFSTNISYRSGERESKGKVEINPALGDVNPSDM